MLLSLAVLTLVHQAAAVVDCRLACRRCREKVDPSEMVEVYCAMCNECKERRVERMHTATTAATVKDDCEDIPELPDCPEPPSCEETEPAKVPLKKKVTTTTTSTTTTTKRPCPKPCKRPPPCFCMPWQPVDMCPCPAQPSTEPWQNLEPPKKLISPNDYMYLYVGVPKDLLEEETEELS